MTRWSADPRAYRATGTTAPLKRDAADETVRSVRFDAGFAQHAALPADVVEKLRSEAQSAGYAAGWAEGRQAAELAAREAREAFAAEAAAIADATEEGARLVLGAVADAVARFEQRATPAVENLEDQLVEAAFMLAEHIIGRELATAAEPGRDAIARALAFAPPGRGAAVRLNPADAATLPPGTTTVEGRDVVVVADPALAPGDAVVECEASTIESRLDAAMERARQALQMGSSE
jgi:flagellar assembly protein FliH